MKTKGNELCAPNLREIVTGLETWIVDQNEERMDRTKMNTQAKRMVIRLTKHILKEKIIGLVNISDWEQTMTSSGDHPDLNFKDPYSKITCLLLYLYSMELGTPPLYAEANRVARDMDFSLQDVLGPFIMGLYFVTMWANKSRHDHDKIKTGDMIGGEVNNIAGSYLLWRGTAMKNEWIDDIATKINVSFKFKGNTSCSRSLKVALGFAFKNVREGHQPVLFVVAVTNYQGILGMSMNHEAYTAYPNEGEYLFMDGATVNVWDFDRDVVLNNPHEGLSFYNG